MFSMCELCGEGAAIKDIREVRVVHKGKPRVVLMSAVWCGYCGEGVMTAEDTKILNAQLEKAGEDDSIVS